MVFVRLPSPQRKNRSTALDALAGMDAVPSYAWIQDEARSGQLAPEDFLTLYKQSFCEEQKHLSFLLTFTTASCDKPTHQ